MSTKSIEEKVILILKDNDNNVYIGDSNFEFKDHLIQYIHYNERNHRIEFFDSSPHYEYGKEIKIPLILKKKILNYVLDAFE